MLILIVISGWEALSLTSCLLQDFPEGKTMVYEQFYYDALEERIRVVAVGKEGEHDVFVDRLLLFREVKNFF